MNKNTKEIIVLILIVFIGINYGVYQYLVIPYENKTSQKKLEFDAYQKSINEVSAKKSKVKDSQKKLEELKNSTGELDNLIVRDIDTPQLIYDFYNACKKYDIKGTDLTFDLSGNNVSGGNTNTSQGQNQTQTGTQTDSQTQNQAAGQQQTNTNQQTGAAKPAIILKKLSITLKIEGSKVNTERFLKNLNTITKRKMNVASIDIQGISQQLTPTIGGILSVDKNIRFETEARELSATIVFTQYVLDDGSVVVRNTNYDFSNGTSNYSSFSDMFK